ncbi:alpha-hydroxy acid oxidase [Actinoplanes sp. NPDC049265]|uniref:alpha-hydroxy acid oxidase n=1 Tax=Actinoplanes sp. NPDC049265 TaxID=3363902 RepID=UPI00371347D9
MDHQMAPQVVNIDDYRTLARAALTRSTFDYVDGGAGDEITCRANRHDLNRIRLRPWCLRDVGRIDMRARLLGQDSPLPVGFSPTGLQRLVHADGEVATARAAGAAGVPMVVSSMSSVALEDVAHRSGNRRLWFQTYVFKDRALTADLVRRAEAAGYTGIVVTVGCPVVGRREKNIRNRFVLPDDVTAANFGRTGTTVHNNPIHSVAGAELDPAATWPDIAWLRDRTDLPIVLKGVLNPLDVPPALDLEVAGLIVSNHGGRQLDTTESAIGALPDIVAAVAGRVPVLVDGGFRRGTDIVKAIALGAEGVLLGRPVLWALAVGGFQGVVDAVGLLAEELRTALQLLGCSSLAELRTDGASLISG